jgi:hypothetical protein
MQGLSFGNIGQPLLLGELHKKNLSNTPHFYAIKAQKWRRLGGSLIRYSVSTALITIISYQHIPILPT